MRQEIEMTVITLDRAQDAINGVWVSDEVIVIAPRGWN